MNARGIHPVRYLYVPSVGIRSNSNVRDMDARSRVGGPRTVSFGLDCYETPP